MRMKYRVAIGTAAAAGALTFGVATAPTAIAAPTTTTTVDDYTTTDVKFIRDYMGTYLQTECENRKQDWINRGYSAECKVRSYQENTYDLFVWGMNWLLN